MRILLAKEGVFPIPDQNGALATGLACNGTIQGEGLLAGTPSLFVRLQGCNLRCRWPLANGEHIDCDTSHTWIASGVGQPIEEVVATIFTHLGTLDHLVITGGEPMQQAQALAEMLLQLRQEPKLHITLETNGSLFETQIASLIDLVSISPKPFKPLVDDDGAPTPAYRGSLQKWLDATIRTSNALQFKFVCHEANACRDEVRATLATLRGWEEHPLFIMPLGATKEELEKHAKEALLCAVANNWRYSPRLQVDFWSNRAGV